MVLLRFSRGSGLAGWIVRTATWSSFSHVGFKLEDGFVLDATPEHGVAIRMAEDDETTQYFQILAPTKYINDAISYARLQLGKPYDWTAIYGMAIRRDWWDDRSYFCSELCEAAFSHAHYPLVRDSKKFDRITPRDLLLSTRIKQIIPPDDDIVSEDPDIT